jgi:hypothetical protein
MPIDGGAIYDATARPVTPGDDPATLTRLSLWLLVLGCSSNIVIPKIGFRQSLSDP